MDKNMENNDYHIMIEEYLEGGLDNTQEQALFSKINSSEELRQTFRDFIAIDNSVKTHAESISPPKETVNALYTKLNIIPGTAAKTGFFAGIAKFFKRSFSSILFSTTTFFLGALLMYLLFDNIGGTGESTNNHYDQGNMNYGIPAAPLNKNTTEKETIIKYVYIDRSFQEKSDNSNNKIALPTHLDLSGYERKNIELPNISTSIKPVEYYDMLAPDAVESDIISIELSNINDWQLTEPTVNPGENAEFNNISLSLMYKINEEFSLGLNYRRENYFLRYESIEELDEIFIYEIQPNLNTLCASMRYEPSVLKDTPFQDLSPYTVINIGANEVGYVGSLGLGLRYSPFNDVSFVFGLNYGKMLFYHQDNPFYSDKIGMNYGIYYSF